MNTKRKLLLQDYIESFHPFVRLIGSSVLCPSKQPYIPKSQLLLLYMLYKQKQMTIKEIAQVMHSSSSAATQLVEHIVESGLAERVETGTDRRQVHVQLTADGMRQTIEYKESVLVRLADVFAHTSDESLEQIVRFQQSIIISEEKNEAKN
ncbi:MarR family transcriptional regulator [Candidatus Saccharibacteria bacterium]|nr:MarR family transcriptional regulator [Candidatus Saccharibacteria bacterium]